MDFLQPKKFGGQRFLDAIPHVSERLLIPDDLQRKDGDILPLTQSGDPFGDFLRAGAGLTQQSASHEGCQHDGQNRGGDPHPPLTRQVQFEPGEPHDRVRDHLGESFRADVGIGYPRT